MTYTEFKTNYKVEVVQYKKYDDHGDKVERLVFHVTGPNSDIGDHYYISNNSMIAEPKIGNHTEHWDIGTHLRNVADEILETIK